MSRIAGVVTEKNAKGEITYVTINVKKHKAAIMPFLEKIGVVEKTKFIHEFDNAISVKKGFSIIKKHIEDSWKK